MMPVRILCLALLLALPAAAQNKAPAAKNTADAERKIESLRKEINTLGKAQRETEEKRNAEARRLRQIDLKVAQSSQVLESVDAAMQGTEAKLQSLQARQRQLEADLSGQKEQLARLLRSAYRMGEGSELKLLLSQDRMAEAARWLAYHRYFERQRQREIGRLSHELQELARVSAEVEREQQQLAQDRQRKQQAVDALSEQRRQRSQAVAGLEAKYKTQQARIKALGKDEKALRTLLDRLRRAASASKAPAVIGRPSGGKAAAKSAPRNLTGWPLTGTLLAGYGNAMPDGRRSEGLLISAPSGTPVYSVAAGRVVYADWLKGYGMLMVVDHGNGSMSLYANNDALLKEVGDAVKAGERIAAVGSSGAQKQSALYFEIRLNGQPQNPGPWLRP